LGEGLNEKAKGVFLNVLAISLATSILGAVGIILGAPYIADVFGNPSLQTVLPIFALVIPLATLNKAFQDTFKAIKIMKYRVLTRDFLNPVVRLAGVIVFLYVTSEGIGIILGHLTGLIVAVIVSGTLLLYNVDWIREADIRSISRRQIFSYSFPLLLAGIIYSFVGQVDYFVIGYFSSSTDVAFYRVAFLLGVNTLTILRAITPVFKPIVAEHKEDSSLLKSRYQTVTRWIILFTLPISATLLIAPGEYLAILFSDEYRIASSALVVLVIGYLMNAVFGPEGMVLEGLGHTRLTFVNTIILVSTNAILDVVLVPQIGIVGAGIATGTAVTVAGFAGISELYFLRGLHPFSTNLIKIWLAIIPAAVLGTFVASVLDKTLLTGILL
ncbi:MAG: oligosaccharide flippase family protein, partial [Halobacteriaceae archaeon]